VSKSEAVYSTADRQVIMALDTGTVSLLLLIL